MIGPILMRYGSPAQQARFLTAIASGRQSWCQGYSEPQAGSDLASLATRAEHQGGHYVVNGSKIWTSGAQHADWIFCLVRTDREARAQQGISFLLIDMASPGITVRPIVGIHGWAVFNAVFFDNVRVPLQNLVGEENQGWTIAKSLLEFERLKLARIGENKRRRARVLEVARTRREAGRPLTERPWFRLRFAELDARLLALEANAARFIRRAQSGKPAGAEVSMPKLRGSRRLQLWEELTVDALGPEALPFDAAAWSSAGPDAPTGLAAIAATASSRRFLARGFTIAGGSSEIQHNILAKQVLVLRAPRRAAPGKLAPQCAARRFAGERRMAARRCSHRSSPSEGISMTMSDMTIEDTRQMLHGAIGMTQEYILGQYVKRLALAGNLYGGVEQHLERLAAASLDPPASVNS